LIREAALGIAVIQSEGAAVDAIMAADVVTQSILDALDLLRHSAFDSGSVSFHLNE
jgi:soluble P-type ATPase